MKAPRQVSKEQISPAMELQPLTNSQKSERDLAGAKTLQMTARGGFVAAALPQPCSELHTPCPKKPAGGETEAQPHGRSWAAASLGTSLCGIGVLLPGVKLRSGRSNLQHASSPAPVLSERVSVLHLLPCLQQSRQIGF